MIPYAQHCVNVMNINYVTEMHIVVDNVYEDFKSEKSTKYIIK